ncbi:MAG: Phosphomethylpyrimidine synthase [candidate division TA06 bacterium 32_111]|uniref:Phosphomethylpyrimidine synthase n=2 Tax=Bacteria candidate phyla TaxID=1783234 RepID=A0A101I2M2_UNCT6|nr:MAG: Phosphomethylpyrimidine synthase [candidate division TA06 bacterium 32_111]KUK87872.1 MAG: Phosphomethylpyrimidine synthase [candidate division TA06 bacterium 34_109]HAF08025.1 phosphomethylpyrimidine synthase [candidate division WOR-3 bacterium]HCP16274.1 phosphomethylpyrimidine synthase [candidate division WOR-3 bacterium]
MKNMKFHKNAIKDASLNDEVSEDFIVKGIEDGTIVLPDNIKRKKKRYYAIGKNLSKKINANIGSSPIHIDIDEEVLKMKVAVEYGAHSVMDLSLGKKIKVIRKKVLEMCPVMVGTVPIYETGFELSLKRKDIVEMKIEDFLKTVEEQAKDGVDFMTIHAGVTLNSMERTFKEKRVMDVVSRGGSFLIAWMKYNGKESPLYTYYDKILDILKEYNVTISLGDGLRPGACIDGTDRGQVEELLILGELVDRAREKGVQVMVEGPGHLYLQHIQSNIEVMKRVTHNAPFYVLGPLVNDISAGYDHIVGAIGGTLAAYFGADFLCYVTPAEHLKLPDVDDVKEGVLASKIAAFSADLALGKSYALKRNTEMSKARKKLDWERMAKLSIDEKNFRECREKYKIKDSDVCSMCGEFCAVKRLNEIIG